MRFLSQVYADAGTVKQNYVNILLMLLRLRQACDHPVLVKAYDSDSVWKSSVETAKKLPREKQMELLYLLEIGLAICGLCNVCGYPVFLSHGFFLQIAFMRLTISFSARYFGDFM